VKTVMINNTEIGSSLKEDLKEKTRVIFLDSLDE
jgi:hypothetical protein